jgi:histone acetyltransferase (RNA polymerase elongator complex component)
MKQLIVPFFLSHQGCPHRCIFCDQVKISGSGGNFPMAVELLARIADYRATAGGKVPEVAFYGGTFTSLPRPVQEQLLFPLQPLLAGGELAAIRVSTRPDAIDAESAEFLGKLGVRCVELGAQSLADDVLALAGRGHDAAAVEEACRVLKGAGLAVGIQLMPGLPGDTGAKALASLRRALALQPEILRFYPTLVIAGTELARLYRDGAYLPMTLDEAVSLCKIMLHEALAADVRVIRIGLQPTGELESAGTVLAGPYHPAFRQLVESALCYDLLRELTAPLPAAARVTVSCAPSRVSDVAGQGRSNLRRLERELGVKVAAVRADPALAPRAIRVEFGEREIEGDIVHDLDYSAEVAALDR